MIEIIVGDCADVLKTMPDGFVNTCVTSPPYFGLRDYGVDGQIGLESSPDEFVSRLVAIFRDVSRVLRDDGTLWLNLGDSYNAYNGNRGRSQGSANNRHHEIMPTLVGGSGLTVRELKNKDLIGIPWRVAFALQQPYYTGKVADERDRVWLAAMMDAEGSICGTEYQTCDRTKTNIYISVTNTSVPIIDKCERLFPQDVKHVYEKSGPSSRICYRWDVERMETKALFLREIYPHLVAKRKQAIVGYTFIELQRGLVSKKKGYMPEQQEQRSWLMAALSRLNAGEDVDLPDWVIEPPSLFEPGFYLRQDLIWSKPNPMPESVRDRCTRAHEYIFMFSKSARYYYDSESIREQAVSSTINKFTDGGSDKQRGHSRKHAGFNGRYAQKLAQDGLPDSRNRRSVWSVATRPFSGAHFATFPPDLIEPCVLAGCPSGGMVLDPFGGAGTTGLVAKMHGRSATLIELNKKYADMARDRIDSWIPGVKRSGRKPSADSMQYDFTADFQM